jgi:hypothetical protein
VLAQGAGFELYVAHENGSDWHETLAGLALRWHY